MQSFLPQIFIEWFSTSLRHYRPTEGKNLCNCAVIGLRVRVRPLSAGRPASKPDATEHQKLEKSFSARRFAPTKAGRR